MRIKDRWMEKKECGEINFTIVIFLMDFLIKLVNEKFIVLFFCVTFLWVNLLKLNSNNST